MLGRQPDFPEITGCHYLIDYLLRLGTVKHTGMGAVNIDYQEIYYWARCVGIELTGWECETLFVLSKAYASQLAMSREKTCPPPWTSDILLSKRTPDKLNAGILEAFEKAQKPKTAKPKARRNKVRILS